MSAIPPMPAATGFELLPMELLHLIFTHLSTKDQYQCSAVSKRWQQCMDSFRSNKLELSDASGEKLMQDSILRKFSGYRKLRKLELPKLADPTSFFSRLKKLACLRGLQSLRLKETQVTWMIIARMGKSNVVGITELSLDNCNLTDATMEVILKNTKLTSLSIKNEKRVNGRCFRQLPNTLKVLEVHNIPRLTTYALWRVRERTAASLQRFSWTGKVQKLSQDSPDILFTCPNCKNCVIFSKLRSLTLCVPIMRKNTLAKMADAAPLLEEFRITASEFATRLIMSGDAYGQLGQLRYLKHLKHLDLDLSASVPDSAYVDAASGGTLSSLSITGFPQESGSVQAILLGNPQLTRLGLDAQYYRNLYIHTEIGAGLVNRRQLEQVLHRAAVDLNFVSL